MTRALRWWRVRLTNGGTTAERVVQGYSDADAGDFATRQLRWRGLVLGEDTPDPHAWRVVSIERLDAA